MADLPPNHHADYRQFAGVFGYLAGLTMIAGRGGDATLVTELARVNADDHVLDVGCGPGTAARRAARTAGRVTGVDPSEPMLRLAHLLTRLTRTPTEIDWVRAGAEALPLPDDSVSVCWSLAAVHHWPDLDAGLAEVQRVLRPGGRFIALEKRTKPGASGVASHGWTGQQAEAFAGMLDARGFADVVVTEHDQGRRQVVAVSGHASAATGR